jgi:hypothetical protein
MEKRRRFMAAARAWLAVVDDHLEVRRVGINLHCPEPVGNASPRVGP